METNTETTTPENDSIEEGARAAFNKREGAIDLEGEALAEEVLDDLDEMPTERPRTAKGALWEVWRKAQAVELLLEQTEGEVDEKVQAALDELAASEDYALEAAADYIGYCEMIEEQAAKEIKRLQALKKRQKERRERIKTFARDILAKRFEGTGKRSKKIGLRTYGLRAGTPKIVVDESVNAKSLPEHLQEWTEEIPAQEAVPPQCKVNEKAALRYMLDCDAAMGRLSRGKPKAGDENLVPIEGFTIVRGEESFSVK